MNKLFTLVFLLGATALTQAQSGTLDPTFGTDGIVTTRNIPKLQFCRSHYGSK